MIDSTGQDRPPQLPATARPYRSLAARRIAALLLGALALLGGGASAATAAAPAQAPPPATAAADPAAGPDASPGSVAAPPLEADAPCTSPEPVVCTIRQMTPEERAEAREVRVRYHALLDRMERTEAWMRAEGASDEDIARELVAMRNEAKDITRAGMSPEQVEALERRNVVKYGNPLGPTADQLYTKYGSWPAVIAASTRTSPAVDRELGLTPHT
ncbi:hypothetical protein [Streptomyces sp. HNM0574]|uniref:hypothetical protein n=1 Tax=Streptomyces sp. HNM0574 TaxID=2714954 RepID=UPI00146F1454|nr:hypothetical protein [Streptomyces sp. HNM0574]NLU69938.1 hypothetical protein [Streptomyces sp. HNM0574]